MTDQLTQLAVLAALQHDAAMAALARHNRDIEDLESCISDLRGRLYAAPASGSEDALPLSLTSGHYGTWQRWVERELTKLNSDLARARAERDTFVRNARQAFGRKSATDALVCRAKQAKRTQARNRHEQSISQDPPGKNPLFF